MPDIDTTAISLYINMSKNDLRRRDLLKRQ